MNRLAGIGETAKTLGVSIGTLRRWERNGRISAEHTCGGHRRYDLDINAANNLKNYAVSSTVSACGEGGSGFLAYAGSETNLCEAGSQR